MEAGPVKSFWDVQTLNSDEKQEKDLWGSNLRAQRPTFAAMGWQKYPLLHFVNFFEALMLEMEGYREKKSDKK